MAGRRPRPKVIRSDVVYMSKVNKYARSLTANWIGYGANLLVAMFLSPFVARRLGLEAFGLWSLLATVTGYLGMVEIGVRVSTGRYINYHLGRGEGEKLSGVVSTSLVFYTAASVAVFAVAVVLGQFFSSIFTKCPPELAVQAKWLLPLLGVNIWLGFYSSTFSQLLHSRDRFDLWNAANIVVLLIRAAGSVIVLLAGGGLTALALVQVGSGVVGCAILYVLARLKGPHLELLRRHVGWATMKRVFSFGTWAFVANVSDRIVYYTDALVIGWLIGFKAVAIYSFGMMLLEYGRGLLANVVRVMTPDIQKYAGRGDLSALRWLAVRATRVSMFFAVPLLVGFMTLGADFIELWLPAGYSKSAMILFILAIPQFGALATRGCGTILSGMGRVKFMAFMSLAEAVCNLALSVFFVVVMGWGIRGVAMGTLVPMMVFNNLVQPIYTCIALRMPVGQFVRLPALRWLVAAGLFTAACMLVVRNFTLDSWPRFAAAVVGLCATWLPIGLYVVLGGQERASLLNILKARSAGADKKGADDV